MTFADENFALIFHVWHGGVVEGILRMFGCNLMGLFGDVNEFYGILQGIYEYDFFYLVRLGMAKFYGPNIGQW